MHPEVAAHPLINIVPLAPAPKLLLTSNKLLFLFFGPLKVLWQAMVLYRALGYRTKPAKFMLVQVSTLSPPLIQMSLIQLLTSRQNPPSIPTLLIASTISLWRNTSLVLDWHNFGFSMLALRLGPFHPFVRISRLYEFFFARSAMANFVVSDAMAHHLDQHHAVKAQTLHDRPSDQFKPFTEEQRSAFLRRLPQTAQHADEIESGACRLVVSSTSWTADEDFSLLLHALVEYSAKVTAQTQLPKVIAIITGKGPQKEYYLSQIRSLNQANKLSNVIILTAWLSINDYASLLGAADLGVSLHTSSSGLDLPMKVVDMFGAGLPVVGWSRYEAWPELVKEGVNGRGFSSAEELKSLLVELFCDNGAALKQLKAGAMEEGKRGWEDEWLPIAGKIFGLQK